jgi:heparan sulfate N-deacetylase/N-sulfotransferase NDST2
VEVSGKSLPVLTNLDKGKYGVIVFENLNKYLQMDKWNRELLDKYCREYSVGIVGFNPPSEETLVGAQLRGFPLFIHTNLRLKVSLLCLLTYVFVEWSQKRGGRLAAAVGWKQ